MYLKQLQIKNFKSFEDVTIEFNKDINIFTGVNNAGKTTMLEAIALWHECFSKLIKEDYNPVRNYKGDYIFKFNKYISYNELNSIAVTNSEDIFYKLKKRNKIEFHAVFENTHKKLLNINFQISSSLSNYTFGFIEHERYDYTVFNEFFRNLPNPIGIYYASPVSAIKQKEKFVTHPQIQNTVLNKKSAKVFRNRLYNLYYQSTLFNNFIDDLSYILLDNKQKIELSAKTDINKNTDVVFNFKIGEKDTEKEISLLGSGTLQIIEILLNFYSPSDTKKDINFVLLDEPDSHIHRDIQVRLLRILTKFTKNTQVFLSTHNEALIRSASLNHLFHLESKPINHYRSLGTNQIQKQSPKFKGIYPTLTNPIISSLGNSNGLDFINAIESDCLIFVEGEDDARVIDALIKKETINNNRRYVYWVLGGVSHVFKEITHYETVFSVIKNEQTLWEKSVLIFDRDYLDDKLLEKIKARLNTKIKTYTTSAYTLESVLFSDLEKLAILLKNWLEANGCEADISYIKSELNEQYSKVKETLNAKFNAEFYKAIAHDYSSVIRKVDAIFEKSKIDINDINLLTNLQNHIKNCLDSGDFYKLMGKSDVAKIINYIAESHNISYTEEDFVSLIQCGNKSTWFDEWNFLLEL